MNLYPLRAELAVMNILGEHRLEADDALPQRVAAASWRRYGLRERDLAKALGRLQLLGMIGFKREGGHRCIVLTRAGCDWLHSLKGVAARALLLPRLARNLFAGLRSPSAIAAMRRRSDDGPPLET